MSEYQDSRFIAHNPEHRPREAVGLLLRLQARLGHIGTLWTNRRRRHREIQALNDFSDRELWDVGLGRSDLPGIKRGTFRRDGT